MCEKRKLEGLLLEYGVYALFFCFYMWLAYHLPYTADDWNWGSEVGIRWFVTASQNSRYAGNLLEIMIARWVFVRIFVIASVTCLISWIIADNVAKRTACLYQHLYRSFYFVCSNILLMTAGSEIWSETIGWIAGFANYVVSVVFFLLCLSAWEPVLRQEIRHQASSATACIGMFLCTFIGQLFTENLTIAVVILAVLSNLAYYYRTRYISSQYLAMLLGALLGLAVMFSSDLYGTLFRDGKIFGEYRQILFLSKRTPSELIYSLVFQIARLVVRLGEENFGLTLAMLGVLTARLWPYRKIKVCKLGIVVNILLCGYYLTASFMDVRYGENRFLAMIAGVINGIYLCAASAEFLLLYKKREENAGLVLILWGCGLLTLLPLLATSEHGARLVFTFECIGILMVMIMMTPWIRRIPVIRMKYLLLVMLIVAMLLSVRFFVIYSANGSCEFLRYERIAEALEENADTIILPVFPYTEYAGRATPVSDEALVAFKRFHHIPMDVEVIFR